MLNMFFDVDGEEGIAASARKLSCGKSKRTSVCPSVSQPIRAASSKHAHTYIQTHLTVGKVLSTNLIERWLAPGACQSLSDRIHGYCRYAGTTGGTGAVVACRWWRRRRCWGGPWVIRPATGIGLFLCVAALQLVSSASCCNTDGISSSQRAPSAQAMLEHLGTYSPNSNSERKKWKAWEFGGK